MEFDELIDHLDDLIALAQSERFSLFAATLVGARARATGSRDLYSRRAAPPSPASSPEADAEERRRLHRHVLDT